MSLDPKQEWDMALWSFWKDPVLVREFMNHHDRLISLAINNILKTNCKIIGFSAFYSNIHFSLELAKRIKKLCPDIIIMMGGPQVSLLCSGLEIIQHEFIDAIFLNEADEIFPAVIEHLKKNNGQFPNTPTPGLITKVNDTIINGGCAPPIKDLNTIPFADYSDFDLSTYADPSRLEIFSSRGCLNHCHYCSERLYFQPYRFRSGKSLYEEVLYHRTIHPNVTTFNFSDSVLNGSIETIHEFCKLLIANNVHIFWGGQAIIRKEMTLQLLKLMKTAGCHFLFYGVESGANKVLKDMNKTRFTSQIASKVIKSTHRAGLSTFISIMPGYPTETEKDFKKTLFFIKHHKKWLTGITPSIVGVGINNHTYLYENYKKFNVESVPTPIYWKTIDKKNSFPVRMQRVELLIKTCALLKIPLTPPAVSRTTKIFLADYYYEHENNYTSALKYYKEDIVQNGISTKSLDRIIFCLKKLDSLDKEKALIEKYTRALHLKNTKSKITASIIVATKDRGQAIKETLLSLVNLDFSKKKYEILIIDNCSSKENQEILLDFQAQYPRIVRYISEEKLGLSNARNCGVANSYGKYLLFLDDDVIVSQCWLKNIINTFQDSPWIYAVGSKVISLFSPPQPDWLDDKLNKYISNFDKENRKVDLTYNECPCGVNIAFRREAFEKYGLFLDYLDKKENR